MSQLPKSILEQSIYVDGNEYFNALLADINSAEKSIDLETYIFENDAVGEKIVAALIAAANRGVKIRVLVDGAGTPFWVGNISVKLESAAIETRVFHPFPWHLWQWSHSYVRVPVLLKAIYLLLKMNSRNHRKVVLIDNKIVYIGSINISHVHLDESFGGKSWRDTAVKMLGVDFNELTKAFDAAWTHTAIPERLQKMFKRIDLNPIIRLNNSRHRRRRLYKDLLKRIDHCKQRIWMTNAYFVPDNFLLRKLTKAAKAGVDVRIVLPKKADVFFMPWASSAFYQSLLEAGVRIFEYYPSMLHTKTLILDDWILVGSSNLNHRSLLHDLEIDVNIRVPSAQQIIEKQFEIDIAKSHEVKLNDWHRPWHQLFFGRLLLYIKYWI